MSINKHRNIGGNSGYVGYSMSCRAMDARRRGEYPKTDFKKVYKVSERSFNALLAATVIENAGWHHVSKFGNPVDFYKWNEEYYASIYVDNKKAVDKLSRDGMIGKIRFFLNLTQLRWTQNMKKRLISVFGN